MNEMAHQDLVAFFLRTGVMLAAALLCGQLMRRVHQPRVLGELVAGIFLGPTVFGALFPRLSAALLPASSSVIAAQDIMLQIGMLFFLFVAGLEVNLPHLRRNSRAVILTSVAGITIPFALGAAAVLLFPRLWGPQATTSGITFVLFIGAALSISALPVIARIFMDLNLLNQPIGGIVLAAATVNDLIGWALFTVVLGQFVPASASHGIGVTLLLLVLFTITVLALGRYVGGPILHWLRRTLAWPSGFISVTAVLILLGAAIAEGIGIHAIFGAFLVGVALGQVVEKENEAHDVIYQFAVSFFAPLYFVSVGLKADFAANFDVGLVLFVLAVATVGKIAGSSLGARLGGMSGREALAIGVGMNARGALEMILATVALDYGIIDERLFVALVTMALVTSFLSGPILPRLLARPQP